MTSQPRRFEEFAEGQSAWLERTVRAEDVARFVELTGDDNPVHVDADYAARRAGGRVVHGMLTASFVSTVIGTMLPGPGALWLSEQLNFRAPVRIDDTLRVEVTVRHISPATRVLVLDVSVRNHHGKVVLDGEARVQVLPEEEPQVADRSETAKTAVVTGAGRGIGAAIARRLAANGLSVVVNFMRDEKSARAVVDDIERGGGTATSFAADVSDPGAVRALVDHAVGEHGTIDVLVNNAGAPPDREPLAQTTWQAVEHQLATHLGGSFLCTQAVLPSMTERRFGRILFVGSQAATGTPPPKQSGYVVAKSAVAAFMRCVALEAGPFGVTANVVAPGMTPTDMVSEIPERTKMTLAAQAPLRRLGTPDDVADIVGFLASAAGAYVTGQTIHVSGGQVMT